MAGELYRPLACGFMPVATPGALPAGGGVVQGPNDSWWRAVPIVRGEVSMNQTPTLRDDLVLASEAALAAGAEVRSRFRDGAEVHYKTPHQPVTEADLRADEILRRHLLKSRPDYGWLSEESAGSAQRLHRRRVWVVDPIDGTNAFVAGRPEFVISIGLVVDGIPSVAAVYNPITEELYRATRGEGATLGGERIEVATPPPAGERPVMLGSRWEIEKGLLDRYHDRWQLRTLGSTAYRMLKVADGSAHAFASPSRKHEWDVCGAALVVTEAGGQVASGMGTALRFNRPDPVVDGIMAWAPWTDLEPPRG